MLPAVRAAARRRARATRGGESLVWTVYLGLFPTAIAFTTWAYALSHTSAGRMGATTYLVPPLATLMGWAYFGETPPTLAIAGGALCLSVALARRGVEHRVARRDSGQDAALERGSESQDYAQH